MWTLLLLLACQGPTPAPSGSRSADLSVRAGEVARQSEVLARRTKELEGLFDTLRSAPVERRPALRQQIREHAVQLREESGALQEEVRRIEQSAQIY